MAGQESTQPTTSYEIPAVLYVTDAAGGRVGAADVDGGTVLYLTGTGFGPLSYAGLGSLLQGVTFGPTGSEVAVSNFAMINASCISIILPAGAGSGHYVRVQVRQQVNVPYLLDCVAPASYYHVQVADQHSSVSSMTFDFASPVILRLSPSTYPTYVTGSAPQIVTVVVANLPVLDPRSRVAIQWATGALQQVRREETVLLNAYH